MEPGFPFRLEFFCSIVLLELAGKRKEKCMSETGMGPTVKVPLYLCGRSTWPSQELQELCVSYKHAVCLGNEGWGEARERVRGRL